MDDPPDVMKQLEKECRQNSLSLALLCMQKARLMSGSFAFEELPKNCIEVCSVAARNLKGGGGGGTL